MSGKWDIIVADEIVGAIAGKVVEFEQVKRLIQDKPTQMDLVLTGHHGQKELFELADLVTEMVQIKHPYQQGILAKEGIDY